MKPESSKEELLKIEKELKQLNEEKPKSSLDSFILTGLATAFTGSLLLGGMKKMGMFGDDEKTPQKLAEEMMAGAIRGIMDYFDWKLDEQKREIERLQQKIEKVELERDTAQEDVRVKIATIEKLQQEAEAKTQKNKSKEKTDGKR